MLQRHCQGSKLWGKDITIYVISLLSMRNEFAGNAFHDTGFLGWLSVHRKAGMVPGATQEWKYISRAGIRITDVCSRDL